MKSKKKNYNFFFIILITVLFILSTAVIFYSFSIAIKENGSWDLPYHATKLFLNKINPYNYVAQEGFAFNRSPYAHSAYLIYAPITFFEHKSAKILWALLNIFFTIITLIIFSKFYKLSYRNSILISLIYLCSLPFRVTIGNGQISIFILFLYSAFFIENKNLKIFILGLSFIKYNFAIITSLYFLKKYGLKYFLISCLFLVIGWLIFSLYLNENPVQTLFQPIQTAQSVFHHSYSRGDLFTLLSILNSKNLILNFNIINIFLCLCFAIFLTMNIVKVPVDNNLLIISLLAIANLLIVPHIIYDYVFLLPSLFYSWKYKKSVLGVISIGIIFYFWFGIKIIYYLNYYIFSFPELNPIPSITEKVINFIMLLILFYSNLSLKKNK